MLSGGHPSGAFQSRRLELVALNETNQSFLTLCRSVKEQDLSGQDAYTVLSLMAQSGEGEAEDAAQ